VQAFNDLVQEHVEGQGRVGTSMPPMTLSLQSTALPRQ
jgi:hypothetical protein